MKYNQARFFYRSTRLKIRSFLVLFILGVFLFSSFSSVLLPTQTANAIMSSSNKASDADWQIRSLLLSRSIGSCFANSSLSGGDSLTNGGRIDDANVASGKWFGIGSTFLYNTVAPVGVYLKNLTDVGSDGKISCDQTSFIKAAMTLWDITPATLLCSVGMQRVDRGTNQSLQDCVNGTTQLERTSGGSAGGWPEGAKKFSDYIKATIYGGNEPNLTDPQWYVFYNTTLASSCIPDINNLTKISSIPRSSDDQYGFNGVKVVDITQTDKDKMIITGSIVGALKKTDTITTRAGTAPSYSAVDLSCSDIVTRMNNYAPAYRDWAFKNRDAATAGASAAASDKTKTDNTTSCAIEGIGWLICPVMNFLGTVADGMYGIIEGFLVTNVKVVDFESGTYVAWQAMRSIANVGFVIMFLIIIFSQLSSVGISNYGVKKILPRLIVVAILVNVSYLISQLAVDLSNILGGSLKTFLDGIPIFNGALDGNVLAKGNWITGIVSSWITGQVVGVVAIGAGAAVYYGGIGLLLPVILVAVVAILMTLFILIARQALIILLVVVSPLAFLAMLLPNTEAFFKKWRKAFVALLLVYPAIALLFGGARLASGILAQTLTGPMGPIVSLAVMVLPLFFVPALLKGSLNAIPAIGGLAQKLSSGASRGTRSLSKKGTDYLGQRAASGNSKFAQFASKSLQGNGMYGRRRQAAAKRNYREPRMKDLMDEWSNDGTADDFGALEKIAGQNPSSFQGQAAIELLAAKSETETLQRIRQNMTDPKQIMAYNKAIQSNYGNLKAKDPRAVKSGNDLLKHYNEISQEELHSMKPGAREAGIALSGGGGSAYSATLGAAMSDPLQSRFFTPKELGRAGDYASIPGGQNFNQSGTEPSTQTIPSVPQKTETPIDAAWADWHREGQTSQTVININHDGEATVDVAPQPQDAKASQAEAKSAAITEAKRLQSAAGNQDIHTDERGRSVPGSNAGGDDDDYRRGMFGSG